MENTALRELLSQFKSEGNSAEEAVQRLKMITAAPMAARGMNLRGTSPDNTDIGATHLSAALAETYDGGLTPLELAKALKAYENRIEYVAEGVKSENPQMTAHAMGLLLLDPALFPDTDRATMLNALITAGYSSEDATSAVNQLYPAPVQTFTVQASLVWQDTGVVVGNAPVTITYQSGQWLCSPDGGMVNAGGSPYYTAKNGYALPGAPEGALVGSINGSAFLVGMGATVPTGLRGPLLLSINDDIPPLYGNGFTDNYGSIVVTIS